MIFRISKQGSILSRNLSSVVSLILLTFTFSIHATEINWSIPEDLTYFKPAALYFKGQVERKSKNKIKVNIVIKHWDVDQYDFAKDVMDGKFQISQELVNKLVPIVPDFKVFELPYLFNSDQQLETYFNSKYGKAHLEKLKKAGLYPIDYTYAGGFIYLYGDKRIDHFGGGKDKMTFFEESNYDSLNKFYKTALNYNVKTSNSDDIINHKGSFQAEIVVSSAQDLIEEVYPKRPLVITRTKHRVQNRVLLISDKFLKTLPKDLRNLVITTAHEAAQFERDFSISARDDYFAQMAKMKIPIYDWTDAQKATARKLMEPLYQEYIKEFGSDVINYAKSIDTKIPN